MIFFIFLSESLNEILNEILGFWILDFEFFFDLKKIISGVRDISETLSEIFLHILGVYMRSLTLEVETERCHSARVVGGSEFCF